MTDATGTPSLPSPDDPAAVDAATDLVHRVKGTVMPVLEVDLQPGQKVISQGGELSWMTDSVRMATSTSGAGQSGVMGVLKRAVAGSTIFMTEYHAEGQQGTVAFAIKLPGEIRPVAVGNGREYLVSRHGFLAGTEHVTLAIAFQRKLGAGVFSGNGFILQRLAGEGVAWIELSGELVEYRLAAGETIHVHPGHVAFFDASVTFDIELVKGIKNMLFGADSLFLVKMTGPGLVWLQTLPLPNLAHALSPFLEHEGAERPTGGTGGLIGGLLGN
jgi:uncharacterized protein (TIGR00266 family)